MANIEGLDPSSYMDFVLVAEKGREYFVVFLYSAVSFNWLFMDISYLVSGNLEFVFGMETVQPYLLPTPSINTLDNS